MSLLEKIVPAALRRVVTGVCIAAIGAGYAQIADAADIGSGPISNAAMSQIRSLMNEKNSRTPTQQKISSQLLYATKQRHGLTIANGVPHLGVNVGATSDGLVEVDIRAEADAASAIAALGAQVIDVVPETHTVIASVSLDRLEDIAALDGVYFISPNLKPLHNRVLTMRDAMPLAVPMRALSVSERRQAIAAKVRAALTNNIPNGYTGTGSANSEGVTAHRVFSARGAFNTTGSGIRIGVLSDGATSFADAQASGDLPATCSPAPPATPATQACAYVVQNHAGDEGTAMMEIIHDVAPGAQLYFATAENGISQFAANVRTLRNTYHCDIIVDDVGYFAESVFQDGQPTALITTTNGGVVTQAVNDVVAAGALYFSSAANSGNLDAGTSGTYEGDFIDGGTITGLPGGTAHNFGGGQQYDVVTEGDPHGNDFISLAWADPLGGSSNDYDLYIIDSAGSTLVGASNNVQSGTQDPFELVTYDSTENPNARLVVFKETGAANRFFHLDTNRDSLSIGTAGNTHGHNAASAAYGVAAAPAFEPTFLAPPPFWGPYPSAFSASSSIEPFTSDGPRRVFFNGAGTAFTPGNFSSTGGHVLQQPVITAADGVQVTGVGGFENPFFGTSAAAPHAAAIAALLRGAKPTLTAAQMKSALTSTATGVLAAGADRDTGYGIVNAFAALQATGATGKAFLEATSISAVDALGDGDGFVEPGEDGKFTITLKNTGTTSASAISATLSTTVPGITVSTPTSAYATLAAGASASNTTSLSFHVAGNSSHVDQAITFTLKVNYTGGWNAQQSFPIAFKLGGTRRTISTTYNANAPATSASFPVTAVGLQTSTLYPTGDWSDDCGDPFGSPGTTGTGAHRYQSYTLQNKTGKTACVRVTATFDKTATDFINVAAYQGVFHGSTLASDTYLADAQYPYATIVRSFSFALPKDQQVVIVVNEYGALDSGKGTPYTLEVLGLGDDRIFFDKFD
jgi:uncharacterized repeat protein (TIGR01451 family)